MKPVCSKTENHCTKMNIAPFIIYDSVHPYHWHFLFCFLFIEPPFFFLTLEAFPTHLLHQKGLYRPLVQLGEVTFLPCPAWCTVPKRAVGGSWTQAQW